MKKELEIKYLKRGNDICLQIVKQTHRCEGFGINEGGTFPNESRFQSSEGFTLASSCVPESRPIEERWLYVRGADEYADNNAVVLYHPNQVFDINRAVFEYNRYFQGKE